MMPQRQSTDDRYWSEYDGLQNAKHQLLRRYLGGWLPILGSGFGRVVYLDSHAGRGRHHTGHEGSPLLALRTLLTHKLRDRILASTEVCFVFFEISRRNHDSLLEEIASLGDLPRNVRVEVHHEDYEPALRGILRRIQEQGAQLAPCFAFVDPYGFSLSMDLLRELLAFRSCELLVNFMYRYVDMAVHNQAQAGNLDVLFGTPRWRSLAGIQDVARRTEETLSLFCDQLGASYVTRMYMRASNGALRYVLLHATNHRSGRKVIKYAMWSVTPDGSFTAFEHHNPDQQILIVPEPDLTPLENALWQEFAGSVVRMETVHEWLLGEIFREPHLHAVLTEWRGQGLVDFSDYEGRFGFGKNPLVSFSSHRP